MTLKTQPTLFIGHGSPMNALANNRYTQTLAKLGEEFEKPEAILFISAHWMSEGTWITHIKEPRTIHDFGGGFPQELFQIQYPAPSRPDLAEKIAKDITSTKIQLDSREWGFDHGTWSVLRHMYPKADVPVIQLSLDIRRPVEFHFKLGQELSKFRDQGILIIGSGNVVHNLRRIEWDEKAPAHAWATQFDEWLKEKVLKRDFTALQNEFLSFEAGKLSNPTLEHYLPFLYILGASRPSDEIKFDYEEIQNAAISMRSVSFR